MARLHVRPRDVIVPAVVAALAAVDTSLLAAAEELNGPAWLALAVQLALAGLLLARRDRPFAMTCAMTVLTVAWWLVEGDPPIATAVTLAFVVSAFSLGRHEADRRLAWAGLAVVGVGLALHLALDPHATAWEDVAAELPWDLLVLGTWAVGALVRYRELYVAGVRAAAVQEERTRVARELHDVTVHGLSVMIVQAEAAEALLEAGDTRRAGAAVAAIGSVGRRSLTDLRASVAALRAPGETGRDPAPDLASLDGLAAHLDAAGLNVDLLREGLDRPIAAAVQLTAYRVVQEGLTNTLRHTTARSAQVVVRAGLRELSVRVRDEGPPRPGAPPPGSGAGLLGLHERVTALGGRLEAAATGGGFTVSATLPLGEP